VAGSVRYEEADMLWKNVQVGTVLGAHSLLQTSTSKDSRVDLELVGDDGRGKCTVRLFPNSVLRFTRMVSKSVGPVSVRDLGLGLAGRILVSLDGPFDYDVELTGVTDFGILARVAFRRKDAASGQTAFLFGRPETLTVIKGSIEARMGTGPQVRVRAGEQLRGGEVVQLPPTAPELRLDP